MNQVNVGTVRIRAIDDAGTGQIAVGIARTVSDLQGKEEIIVVYSLVNRLNDGVSLRRIVRPERQDIGGWFSDCHLSITAADVNRAVEFIDIDCARLLQGADRHGWTIC